MTHYIKVENTTNNIESTININQEESKGTTQELLSIAASALGIGVSVLTFIETGSIDSLNTK